MKRRRAKVIDEDDGLSPAERVCALLRDVQWKSNCSTQTLQNVLDSLRGKLGQAIIECQSSKEGLPRNIESADQKMRHTVCLRCVCVCVCVSNYIFSKNKVISN